MQNKEKFNEFEVQTLELVTKTISFDEPLTIEAAKKALKNNEESSEDESDREIRKIVYIEGIKYV